IHACLSTAPLPVSLALLLFDRVVKRPVRGFEPLSSMLLQLTTWGASEDFGGNLARP
ncbi:MAG: hypothetical protein RLZZ32_1456, partial [Cyanobacteriota bacterium]